MRKRIVSFLCVMMLNGCRPSTVSKHFDSSSLQQFLQLSGFQIELYHELIAGILAARIWMADTL